MGIFVKITAYILHHHQIQILAIFMSTSLKIDVIIPCYNAALTLERAVASVLVQPEFGQIWVVDDASTDNTVEVAQRLQALAPKRIRIECLPQNGGVARARNWGMLNSDADVLAFLDADDAFEANVLAFAAAVMRFRPEIPMLRLALRPVDIAPHYTEHERFDYGWRHVEMTVGGNMVFRRDFLLACGGFPQDALFRRFGGEDVALSLAVLQTCVMGTAFEQVGMDGIAVLHHCRPNMHAYKLLDAVLFGATRTDISPEDQRQADAVTARIASRLRSIAAWTQPKQAGKLPLNVTIANQ